MNVTARSLDRYQRLLGLIVFAQSSLESEQGLAEAFELGRSFVEDGITPDQVASLHHEAIIRLGAEHPELRLAEIAERLMLPLIELTMAHGMAFREQVEQRYQAQLNARLEQSSKLEAVGTLAAGIAHDFNNIIGSIVGFAEMTADEFPDDAFGRRNMAQVLIACQRAGDLVKRMLAFAREEVAEAVNQDLVAEVREAVGLLAPTLGEGVGLSFASEFDRLPIIANPGSLQQIVINLCINAAEAMEGRGKIEMRLAPARDRKQAPAGYADGIVFSIADNGPGMPPEIQARVFDPFFTTKAPKGSGLGLSVTHGIVQQLGGIITLSSQSGGGHTGTEFMIWLPPISENGQPDSKQQGATE